MRKLMFPSFLVNAFLMISISGCAPAQTPLLPSPIPPSSTQQITISAMPVSVVPFYDSEGTQVKVGNYSEQLSTDDLQVLTAMAQEMAQQKEILTPEQMYVLAIRLYDLGDKDDSVYWYYEAQFRARLFNQALESAQYVGVDDQTFILSTAYSSFQQLAGEFINGYAGCDLAHWAKVTKMVQEDNTSPPKLDQIFPDSIFVSPDQWQKINGEVAKGLADLTNYISDNGEAIKQQRAQKNMDVQYCN